MPNPILILNHRHWLEQSSVFGQRRSKELREIDQHILRYGQAVSDYGREWEANELRIAFDTWKKAEGPGWKKSSRNKTHAMSRLHDALLQLAPASSQPTGYDTEVAYNLRYGTLYFLAHLKSDLVPSDWGSFFNDNVDAGSDVHDLIQTTRKQGVMGTVAATGAGKSTEEASKGFLKSLLDALKDYLGSLAGTAGEYAARAAQFVIANLPDLLKTVLGAVLKNLTSAVEIAGNLVKATRAALATFQSRNLEDAILSGHPRNVIHGVREQIKDDGKGALKDAAKSALLTGISTLNPIAGTVCAAVASVYKFVTDLYSRYKDRLKLSALIDDAKKKLGASWLVSRPPEEFNAWFLDAIKDMPLLSSYLMCLPMTGSYYGFLTLVTTDGSEMAYGALERNYGMFNDVKVWARKFVQADKIKLRGDNELVNHSLASARGESASEFRGALAARMKKTTFALVEGFAG
jgi:hypothetical protein